MKKDLYLKKTIRQMLAALVSIMMLMPVQRGWAQNPQSGHNPGSRSSATTPNDLQTTTTLRSSSVQAANIPNVMLTKGSTPPLTKTGDTGISISPDSLVKIHNPAEGTTSDPVGWNTAFNQIQPGEEIHLYQNVTLTNTVHVLPAEDCTIDGNGYELHYTQNGAEKALVLDADITFKNIKLFNGLIAWGHKVVFESDITLSYYYSVWGGEYRNDRHTIDGREDYVIENTHITIKSGAFSNIYGGSSDGEITGSTYVKIEGGTFNDIYGGNSHAEAKAIPGNTEVVISGGIVNGNVFGACLRGSVQGTANLSISGNAVFNGHVLGGSIAEEATVKDINVNISGGTFYSNSNNWVYGGSNLAPVTGTITMLISGGTFNGFLACGGNEAIATAQNTSLSITGGTFHKWVYGGGGNGPVTETAKTDISGGIFVGSICGGGLNAAATCGNTDMTFSNVSLGNSTWVYGGGEEGGVTGLAKVTVKSGTINKTVYGGAGGWDTGAACGNTEVVVEGGTIGWVYGGGNLGKVTETAKVNISGGSVKNSVFGGSDAEGATVGNTSVNITGGTQNFIYGGGWNGNVTGTATTNISGENTVVKGLIFGSTEGNGTVGYTDVTVNTSVDNPILEVHGAGINYDNTVHGKVTGDVNVTILNGRILENLFGSASAVEGKININVKGGEIRRISGIDNSLSSNSPTPTYDGTVQIIVEGGNASIGEIISHNFITHLTYRNCGTADTPYPISQLEDIEKVILENSFIKEEDSDIAFRIDIGEKKTMEIEGTGLAGDFHIVNLSGEIADHQTIIRASELSGTYSFMTDNKYLYKAGSTYRYPGNNTLRTVNIQTPDATIGTLTVKWDETVLENGDQVPDGTILTVTSIPTGENKLVVKDNKVPVTDGTLTVTADVNLTVSIDGGLDLTNQITDITISKTGDQWQYLALDLKSTSMADFNGIITGTLPDNRTLLIDGSAKGELTFYHIIVDAGSTGTAITVASGADIDIKGSLEAKTSDSAAPAIANNGRITTTTGTHITAINSGDSDKGISVSDGATLLLAAGSTLTASGIDNAIGGTVIARKGSTVGNSTSENSRLLKTYIVAITDPGNGNTLTVKAGDINVASEDKATQNTSLTLTATPATNYLLEKIIVTSQDGAEMDIANNTSYTMGMSEINIDAFFKYDPPYIPPVTTYHTVTLPSVEGATCSKKAGDHTVEEGYSFTFTITLDEDYSESVPIVTTDRSETIIPDVSGKYKIGNVAEDIVISISGIVKNLPTGIDGVETGTKIWVANGMLFIRTSSPQQVQVVNLTGSTVIYRKIPAGYTRLEGLPAGVYIIRLSEKTVQKIVL